MTVAALLFAAGESSRMGYPKALLDWGGEPMVAFQVHQLLDAGVDSVILVLGHEAARIRPNVPAKGVLVVVNEAYRDGRATSVRTGANAVGDDVDSVVLLNVDQPRPADVIRRLLAAHRELASLITVPEYQGHRQHPIVLSGALLPELRAVDESTKGLRAVMERHTTAIRRVAIDDPRLALDVNTPNAYAEAHHVWFGWPPAGPNVLLLEG